MEEIQDAIEDAAYMMAMQERSPQPCSKFKTPTDEQIEKYKEKNKDCLSIPRICEGSLGFYMVRRVCNPVY
jgi:hypothetical protein